MVQKVYGLTVDGGDGSTSIRWFRDKEKVDYILDNEDGDFEQYYGNEGSPAVELTFPGTLVLTDCGFRFHDDRIEIPE